jgi:hypothetical protein
MKKITTALVFLSYLFTANAYAEGKCKQSDVALAKSIAQAVQTLSEQGGATQSQVALSKITVAEADFCAANTNLETYCSSAQTLIGKLISDLSAQSGSGLGSLSVLTTALQKQMELRKICD